MQDAIDKIRDPGFRTRFVNEFDTVRRWCDKAGRENARIIDLGCGPGIAVRSATNTIYMLASKASASDGGPKT